MAAINLRCLPRGGGTTCMSDPTVWKIFKKCVKNIEPCPRSHKSNKGNLNKHLKKLQTKPWKRNHTKHLKKTQSNSWKMRRTKYMRKIKTKLWKKMRQSKFSPSKHIRGFWKSTREWLSHIYVISYEENLRHKQGVPWNITAGDKFEMSSSIICLIPKRMMKNITKVLIS